MGASLNQTALPRSIRQLPKGTLIGGHRKAPFEMRILHPEFFSRIENCCVHRRDFSSIIVASVRCVPTQSPPRVHQCSATPPNNIDQSTILKIGRLLADYASSPINLCSVRVTFLAALLMSGALGMITRYPLSLGTALTR